MGEARELDGGFAETADTERSRVGRVLFARRRRADPPASSSAEATAATPASVPTAVPASPEQAKAGLLQDLDASDERAEEALNKKVPLWIKAAIAASLVGIMVLSFAFGRYPINPVELMQTLAGLLNNWLAGVMQGAFGVSVPLVDVDPKMATALVNIRLPRILVVVMVGAALAVAGASYQGMFKNPLVSPDLLGASAGASFGACLALLLDLSNLYVQLFAFVGAMVAVGGAVWMNRMVNKYDAILGLVLGGMLVSTLFQSCTSLVKFMADANDKLPAITFWLMGSFSRIDQADFWMILLPMVLGFAMLLLERWKLNVLSFGEEEAKSLGINTKRVRLIVIFASTLIVACSVAVSGIVGWVGLVIPHLARAIVGPNYKVLLPASMFIGAGYLLLVDDIARLVSSTEIPIGILTAILGVPFFIFIFKHNMKGW
ncbi:FecCD family ABC transporter permease [Gordonibacter massiliensis (ex Traore et al. 2017)]|uniref:FecCD family ABC transporter permease n=1 Tax=Gordonibacter massiliensis (ex Traore et al. 2017) TaxID=1841863 RepID=UPI0034A01821